MAAEGRSSTLILRVSALRKTYVQRHPLSFRRRSRVALDGVDLELARGSFLALVGESGSGKSTLARCIACLEKPSSGSIWFQQQDVTTVSGSELRRVRPKVQLIFQDAATALNPRFSAAELVEEPLHVQQFGTARERRQRALDALSQVGLSPRDADRSPHQFSGGQRQRLAIARALVQNPELLVLDEALSGLDLSLQAQVLNLLLDLRESHRLTYLYISHDLSLARRIADQLAVMHAGRIVEYGQVRSLFDSPKEPATQALIAAIPEITRQRAAYGSE